MRQADHPQARVAVHGTFGNHHMEYARSTRTTQYTGYNQNPLGNCSWNLSLHGCEAVGLHQACTSQLSSGSTSEARPETDPVLLAQVNGVPSIPAGSHMK